MKQKINEKDDLWKKKTSINHKKKIESFKFY
jgi:hypothetical protein